MLAPIFYHFNGWLNDDVVKYTAVLTPHFVSRICERGYRIGDTHFKETIPKFWEAAQGEDTCYGTEVGNTFIYFKRKWNGRRKRWELEFISITPNRHFHTDRMRNAVRVEL